MTTDTKRAAAAGLALALRLHRAQLPACAQLSTSGAVALVTTAARNTNARCRRIRRALPAGYELSYLVPAPVWTLNTPTGSVAVDDLDALEVWAHTARAAARLLVAVPAPPATASEPTVDHEPPPWDVAPAASAPEVPLVDLPPDERAARIARLRERQKH